MFMTSFVEKQPTNTSSNQIGLVPSWMYFSGKNGQVFSSGCIISWLDDDKPTARFHVNCMKSPLDNHWWFSLKGFQGTEAA